MPRDLSAFTASFTASLSASSFSARSRRVAKALGSSAQKVHYHVKALEDAALVERVSERRVKGIVEGVKESLPKRKKSEPKDEERANKSEY